MRRVRLFGDWGEDSTTLIARLRNQTAGFKSNTYEDIEFVDDDAYEYAVVFNFPVHEISSDPDNNILLMLEPPEVSSLMHRDVRIKPHPQIGQFYSFCDDDIFPVAYGIHFISEPIQNCPSIHQKTKQICMITSDKLITPYHYRRHEIKDALLASDLDIDFYGRNIVGQDPRIKGTIPPMYKYQVIKDYKYCIDFENSSHLPITEKYFDPILCNTVPITNNPKVNELAPNSAVVIDFDWPLDDIVEAIRIVSKQEPNYDTHNAKREILSGNMCLAKWIVERINKLGESDHV